jgi:NADH-quinone oxidoreductase subunit M
MREWERPKLFYLHFMLAESAVLGAFLAQDLALFVAFFDLMLIPFYFLIGIWGGPNRVKATIKLVIYTLVGSLLMLAAAIATGVLASQQDGGHITFVLSALQAMPLSKGSQEWIFLFFAAAFLVKMPAFPLHGWMPDGYKAMPIEVLMVFSGVLSKVGAYGFLAIVLPLFPQGAAHFQILMLLIALCSILYGSAVAFTQTDARLIAGYSSVAQMGFITLGIFSLNPQGAQGALLQMVNHGLVVAPLLFIILLLSKRAGGSEDIREMGGIAFRAPVLASLFLIVALATLAIPGSSNFAGEFLILLGVFKAKLAIAIIAFTGVVMASVYALRLFIRAMHNRVGSSVDSREISIRDGAVLVPLIAVILFLALYPQFALHRSEGSVKSTVAAAHVYATVNPASVHVFATNSSPIRTGTISGEARQESGEPEAQQASEDGASSSERGAPAGTR